jgi:hypothetical protein
MIAKSPSAVAQGIGPLRTVVRADEVPVENPRGYLVGAATGRISPYLYNSGDTRPRPGRLLNTRRTITRGAK